MALGFGPKLGFVVSGDLGENWHEELMRFLRGYDALLQCTAKKHTQSLPPGSPSDGDVYLLPLSTSGDWFGNEGRIARWSAAVSAWEFYEPNPGWLAWSVEQAGYMKFTSDSGWVTFDTVVTPPVDEPDPLPGYQGSWYGADLSLDSDVATSLDSGEYGGAALGYYTQYTAKCYVEFLVTTKSSDNLAIGIIDAPTTKAELIDGMAYSEGWFNSTQKSMHIMSNGNYYKNGGDETEGSTFGATDRIGIAIDKGITRAWILKNGMAVDGGNPVAGTGGTDISDITLALPFVGFHPVGNYEVQIFTLEADQLHTPSGFNAWIPSGGVG